MLKNDSRKKLDDQLQRFVGMMHTPGVDSCIKKVTEEYFFEYGNEGFCYLVFTDDTGRVTGVVLPDAGW